MTDLKFNEILEELKSIHQKFPDLRFGEVVQNSIDGYKRLNNLNLNDKSSKEILKALKEFNSKTNTKRSVDKHGRKN